MNNDMSEDARRDGSKRGPPQPQPQYAPRSVGAAEVPDDGNHVQHFDEEASDADEESDSDSLLLDILNGDYDEQSQPHRDSIPQEEALALQSKLRELGPNNFILRYLSSGLYTARRLLTAFGLRAPEFLSDDATLRLLGISLLRELNTRRKLPQYNTLEDVVELLRTRQKIMVITGAGISTNLGVPDFRSKNTGFYDQMREKGFSSPEDIFDIHTFREDPSIFYSNASPTLPEPSKSTPTHAFIKLLDDKGKLLTNYTQNIDNVEGNVEISKTKLIQCHGSWANFTCTQCGFQTDGRKYYDDVKAKRVVRCTACRPPSRPLKRKRSSPGSRSHSRRRDDDSDDDGSYDIFEPGVMKPDITFFGEKLPDAFFDRFKNHDINAVDLIVVIGTSMSVSPVSEIPMAVSPDVPQVLISRDKVRHVHFDVSLLGDCDLVTEELAKRLRWDLQHRMLKRQAVKMKEVDHEAAVWRMGLADEDLDEKDEDANIGGEVNSVRLRHSMDDPELKHSDAHEQHSRAEASDLRQNSPEPERLP